MEAFPKAKAAAQRALEIDPTLAEAHTQMGYVLVIYDWNWKEAESEFKRALELDPNNTAAHFRYGQMYLAPMGRLKEAIAEIKRAMELEPLDLTMGTNMVSVYSAAQQNILALDLAKKLYELEPGFPVVRWALGQAFLVNGMYREAVSISEEGLKMNPTHQALLRNAGCAYAKLGRRREAEEMIKRFKVIEKTSYVMSCRIAAIYAALGEKDLAFAELEKAYINRDWDLHRLKVDPFMDPLRSDPRFADLLKRVGLEK